MYSKHRAPATALVVVGLTAVVALAACSSSTPTASGSAVSTDTPVQLGLQLINAGGKFTAESQAGAQAAAKDFNVNLTISTPPSYDPPTAISQTESMLASGVQGVGIAVEPASLWTRTLADAFDKTNGNVIATNAPPDDGSPVATYIGVQVADYASQLATNTVKAAKLDSTATGTVIVGECSANSSSLSAETAAALTTVKSLLPQANVLPVFVSDPTPDTDISAWGQEIAANPNTILALGFCDQDADAIIKAKQTSGGTFAIGVVQTSQLVLAGLQDGTVTAALLQPYYVISYLTVKLLAESVRSGTVPPSGWIDTGSIAVTNADYSFAVNRDASDAGLAAAYAPLLQTFSGDLAAVTKPIAEARP